MDRKAYRDEIAFRLTGGVLELELDDSALDKVIDAAFRELQRYIDTSKFITLPYKSCIDLKDCGVSAVTAVYRCEGFASSEEAGGDSALDPMYAMQWQLLSGVGNIFNMTDYVYNYAAWNTTLQIRNTTSTDLAFIYDSEKEKLYINTTSNMPNYITVEFVPRYKDVSEIVSDYWIDMVMRLSVALAKVTLGRIRSRYTQSGALWGQDGERLLEEGNSELSDLRDKLYTNSTLAYPID